jgi:putative chitinase
MATPAATVAAVQKLLQREFPRLKVDGVWGNDTSAAFSNASHGLRIDVIRTSADMGHALNDLQKGTVAAGNSGKQGKGELSMSERIARTAAETLQSVRHLFDSTERRFYDRAKLNGLDDVSIRKLMTQVRAESNFQPKKEGHVYSDPARARRTFSALRSFSDSQIRSLIQSGADAFFETVYGSHTVKGRELGNRQPGDGAKYPGRGLLQITGYANYDALHRATGLDVLRDPDLLVRDVDASIDAAVWYWRTKVMPRGGEKSIARATVLVAGHDGDVDRREQIGRGYNVA